MGEEMRTQNVQCQFDTQAVNLDLDDIVREPAVEVVGIVGIRTVVAAELLDGSEIICRSHDGEGLR
jgi:hypothetical protein